MKRRYLYGTGFAPVQVHDVSGTTTTAYDVHTDHLDTPRLLTKSTGAAVWRSRHEAFGNAHIEADPDGDGTSLAFPFRFPGQYEDPETGLHYNWHRYYDPDRGRYLSADSLGQTDQVNLYLYAYNDPVRLVDPQGLFPNSVDAKCARGSPSGCAAAGWPPSPQPPILLTPAATAEAALRSVFLQALVER